MREMLTYLAAVLPRFSSPAARLLAVQCALRADTSAYVRLTGGLLRGMRLCGRRKLWRSWSTPAGSAERPAGTRTWRHNS
ncbi:hypothetical protein [Streptomyces mirabilis]|uniref:hypothetical protein n=1 Tax=Streptomyces mirabilis TaxID=68239 RepID=UPI0036629ABF